MSDVPPRLFRDALRRTAAMPASSCIDAETLAAWADGSLPLSHRAALESHAASCERCQALIAAMTRTAPPAAPQRRWWRSIGWLVPVGAAAAALVLWIAVPEHQPARPAPAPRGSAESQVAQTAPALPPPPSSPESRAPRGQVDVPAIDQTEPRQRARSEPGSAMRAEQSRAAAAGADQSPSPEAAALGIAPFTASKDERAGARGAQANDLSEARAGASPGAGASGSTSDPTSPQARLTEAGAPRATLNAVARPAVQDAAKTTAAVVIVSPDANVRWRINGTNVERSGDAGATWQMQSTGASAALTAGAAPSRTVCWMIGAAGTVTLSIDGRSWQRLAFPEPIDLRAVRASDAAHAVVTAVDGRTFATIDGGRTWQSSGPR
jgi:hypothetical protein